MNVQKKLALKNIDILFRVYLLQVDWYDLNYKNRAQLLEVIIGLNSKEQEI
jgi:hypothetical protein